MKKIFVFLFFIVCSLGAMITVPTKELELAIKSNDFQTLEKLFAEYLFIDPNHCFQIGQFKNKSLLQVALEQKCWDTVTFLIKNNAKVKLNDIAFVKETMEPISRSRAHLEALATEENEVDELEEKKAEEIQYV